ncbi:MAG: M23 family metallopeptidase [Candidatus Binatia bacterium]
MEKRYSILIVAPREARIRRLGFTLKSAGAVATAATLILGFVGWFLGDYLWTKIETTNLNRLKLRASAQREQYSRLHGQAQNIQTLLVDWKALQEKIDTSVPQQHRLAPKSRYAIAEVQQSLNSLKSELEKMIASLPTDWPATGRVTSGVGDRVSPLTGRIEFHSGIDIPNPIGTPVYAPGNATVEATGEMNGNGRTVVLNHGQGITTQYLHLSKIHVNQGQQVRKGQQIAEVGNTGRSTSPHLHYEVRVNGVPIDPRQSLLK